MPTHSDSGRLTRAQAEFLTQVTAARQAGGERLVIACAKAQRIPTSFLGSERVAPSAAWQLSGLSDAAAVALCLMGVADQYHVSAPTDHQDLVADPPCHVDLLDDGTVVVTPVASAATHPLLASTMAHAWMTGLAPAAVMVDLAAIPHLTSVVIAWQLQLLQCSRPASFTVRGANPGVIIQLKQLRLDYVMALA
jgi:hypothetical protein